MSARPQMLLRKGAVDFVSTSRRQPLPQLPQIRLCPRQQQSRKQQGLPRGCHAAAFTTYGARRNLSSQTTEVDAAAAPASPLSSPSSSSPSSATSSSTSPSDSLSPASTPASSSSPYSSFPDSSGRPRWTHTPERMKAPFSLQQPKDPRRSQWKVNEDPAKLDRMYERLLGRDLARSLPEELKWLAVTHKSFDNGRRGFNTRLAFFGRMIVALESTRAIMGSPAAGEAQPDPHGREPFRNAALAHVDKLAWTKPHDFTSPQKLVELTRDIGLPPVVRWKPRLPENLDGSGFTVVMVSTLYAIVGAVSLHHGAQVASRVVEEKIIRRLGA